MHRTIARPWILLVVLVVGLLVPWSGGSAATSPATSPTTCPITHALASPGQAPWLAASYQQKYTPQELATQVVACETALHPSTAFLAELAVIGLNNTPNKVYQNENMSLATSAGVLTPVDDFETLGIPALTLEDGPDGVIYKPPANQPQPTLFPNELALASTMSPQLAEQYGEELGLESSDFHFMGVQAPDLNLDRIPNWGRMQETFGEDPVLAGEMGAAETTGILQNSHLAVLKHFGLYGQETSRRTMNVSLTGNALYDTYVRPFAITMNAVASSAAVPADRQVAVMCSYGNLNGDQSCVSPTLAAALATLPYSGLERSDLDTGTTTPAMLRTGVSLIKPLVATQFEPVSAVSAQNRSLVRAAATKVIATMFAADLVTPTALAEMNHVGTLGTATAQYGTALANVIEEHGAVLLKNDASGALGSLPVSHANGSIALIAPLTLQDTCRTLAASLAKSVGVKVTCTIWNARPSDIATIFSQLPIGTTSHELHKAVKWVAPTTGPYQVACATYGQSYLSLNGTNIQSQPGLNVLNVENDTTINVVKGHAYTFKETWGSVGPDVTIQPLAPEIAVAVAAARKARSAVVLADSYAAEGVDRDELAMPDGQDAAVSAVAAAVPTSVALVNTGPVTMPWLSSVDSVIELWNPAGLEPFDAQLASFVPAYTALLDGHVSPAGHLPVTFPAAQSESPMSIGTGANRFSFWPGVNGTSNLALAPLDGTVIGYGWYQAAGWPVLFPFGYGLTYASMSTAIDPAGSCATTDSATAVCVPITVQLTKDVGRPANDAVQVYVSQPSSSSDPRPLLVLGAASSVVCRDATGPTSACDGATDTDETISALDVGAWSSSAKAYQFLSGCYAFVTAADATDAYGVLANPGAHSDEIAHATAPFSASTTLSAGACP